MSYLQTINRLFTGIMENRIAPEPGNELFANFLINKIPGGNFIYEFYVGLTYGDQNVPRSIPIHLIAKHWPEQIPEATQGELISNGSVTYVRMKKTREWDPKKTTYDWDHLVHDPPPRLFTGFEKEVLERVSYLYLLEERPTELQALDELIELCNLLKQPENHIKIPSGQYVERPTHIRQVHDMTDEMGRELTNLPRYQAYTKLIDESGDKQTVKTHRIQTHPLPARNNTGMVEKAIANACIFCKTRDDIEAEIRERQSRWGRGDTAPQQSKRVR